MAKPEEPEKLDIYFKLSLLEETYSPKNLSFLGTIYPSILKCLK